MTPTSSHTLRPGAIAGFVALALVLLAGLAAALPAQGSGDEEILLEFKRYFRKYKDTPTRIEAVLALEGCESPEVVGVRPAEAQRWESTLSAVASVVSAKGVALSNDAPGVVSRLHFESGALVKQGQVLVELDTKVERAQLASLRARRDLAQTSLQRSTALAKPPSCAKLKWVLSSTVRYSVP